jgi:hypothetical protein
MKVSQKYKYVMCVENEGYSVSLEKRKIYQVESPEPNDPKFMLRVIDESGEGYLFPAKWFVSVKLPVKARRAMAISS